MKKLLYASLFVASAGFAACNNGDYDANPNVNNSNTANPINTGGNTGGGNNGGFNWSGTDPMSAKIDGSAWQAATSHAAEVGILNELTIDGETSDYNATSTGSAFALSVPIHPVPGTVYTCNSTNTSFSYTDATQNSGGGSAGVYNTGFGGSGAIKITDTATNIKGYFYGTVKNASGTAKTITEGYFNVPK